MTREQRRKTLGCTTSKLWLPTPRFWMQNVLHPMVLCDLLIRLGLHGFYRPLFYAEWDRHSEVKP